MTDITTPAPTEAAFEENTPTATPESPGTETTSETDPTAREAVKYRRRLREAESERDALAARLQAAQRREIERLAAESLAQPGDLFDVGGKDVPTFVTADGEIDAAAVTEAVAALLAARPGLHKDARVQWPDSGAGRRGHSSPAEGTTWTEVLKRR